jgi:hypothetical protein
VKRIWLLMTEGIPLEGETEIAEVSAAQRKCTMQRVLIAALRHRYLSCLTLTDQSIVESAFPITGSPERKGTKLRENHTYTQLT